MHGTGGKAYFATWSLPAGCAWACRCASRACQKDCQGHVCRVVFGCDLIGRSPRHRRDHATASRGCLVAAVATTMWSFGWRPHGHSRRDLAAIGTCSNSHYRAQPLRSLALAGLTVIVDESVTRGNAYMCVAVADLATLNYPADQWQSVAGGRSRHRSRQCHRSCAMLAASSRTAGGRELGPCMAAAHRSLYIGPIPGEPAP